MDGRYSFDFSSLVQVTIEHLCLHLQIDGLKPVNGQTLHNYKLPTLDLQGEPTTTVHRLEIIMLLTLVPKQLWLDQYEMRLLLGANEAYTKLCSMDMFQSVPTNPATTKLFPLKDKLMSILDGTSPVYGIPARTTVEGLKDYINRKVEKTLVLHRSLYIKRIQDVCKKENVYAFKDAVLKGFSDAYRKTSKTNFEPVPPGWFPGYLKEVEVKSCRNTQPDKRARVEETLPSSSSPSPSSGSNALASPLPPSLAPTGEQPLLVSPAVHEVENPHITPAVNTSHTQTQAPTEFPRGAPATWVPRKIPDPQFLPAALDKGAAMWNLPAGWKAVWCANVQKCFFRDDVNQEGQVLTFFHDAFLYTCSE